jgi:hypothetical protein
MLGKGHGEAGEAALSQLCPGQIALESGNCGRRRIDSWGKLFREAVQLRAKQLPKLLAKLCQRHLRSSSTTAREVDEMKLNLKKLETKIVFKKYNWEN